MTIFPALYALARKARFDRLPGFDELYERSYFVYKRLVEDPFHHVVRAHGELFRDGHVLDVGGNVGYNALLFARALSPAYRVYSFEPEPHNATRQRRRLGAQPLGARVTVVEKAVGAASGPVYLRRNLDHPADHRVDEEGDLPVQMTSLDDFVGDLSGPRDVAFVKIDVQGDEPAVLVGMSALLAQDSLRAVAFEYAPEILTQSGFSPDALFAPFAHWHAYTLHPRRGIARAATIPPRVDERGYVDLLFTRRGL